MVHREYRGHGYGDKLLEYAIEFAKQKNFLRITLLTDRPELRSQTFLPQARLLRIARCSRCALILPRESSRLDADGGRTASSISGLRGSIRIGDGGAVSRR